jgi:2-dehydropantoate 2-reductase
VVKIAVLGPGGVGGLLAGVLARAGEEDPLGEQDHLRGGTSPPTVPERRVPVSVCLIARESTAQTIAERGLSVRSVMFGDFNTRVRASERLHEPVDVLIVATKAAGLDDALERIEVQPGLVLPLLNGLDHIPLLRRRFDPETVLAGTIRVESDRPEPGVVVHTSPFLLIDMATRYQSALAGMQALAKTLEDAGMYVRQALPVSEHAEAQVMWSKLVRLNALACTTSAYDTQLGEIRRTPELRADLEGCIEEACAVGRAEGAEDVDPQTAISELELAHETLGSSMQRDIAAGREPELDAIPGAVLRAGARHGLRCPTIERLVAVIAKRAGAPAPLIAG